MLEDLDLWGKAIGHTTRFNFLYELHCKWVHISNRKHIGNMTYLL